MYTTNGKQILFVDGSPASPIHIADASNLEAAHALATAMNERSPNFIRDALRTCSPNFYGERVAKSHFIHAMNAAIGALTQLDKVKKSLFYGKDNNLDPRSGEKDAGDVVLHIPVESEVAIDLIHGIIGKATEAGELLEALRNAYNGNGLDFVNINEELGDGFWYDAIILNRTDATFEEVQGRIISKLRARFPDKYTDNNAIERDLAAERAILEDKREPLLEEGVDPEDLRKHHPEAFDTGIDEAGDMAIAREIEANEAFDNRKPLIAPSVPASGKEAVKEVADSAAQAFAAISDVQANVGNKPEEGPNQNPELAKPIGERLRNMPQENMARAAEHTKKNDG